MKLSTIPLFLAATLMAAPVAGQGPEEGTRYAIISRISTRALDVGGRSMDNGANVHQWDYVIGADNQLWRFEEAGEGYHRIRVEHSGQYLTVDGNSNGANVFQQSRNGNDRQQWRVERLDNGFYSITNRSSGKALEVYAGFPLNGANVRQWDYQGNENQQWRLFSVELSLVPGNARPANSRNLGPTINTECDEVGALPTLDGTAIYYTLRNCSRTIEGVGTGSGDVWYAPSAGDGNWGQAVPVGAFNNNQANAASGLSADGNTMLLRGTYRPDGTFHPDGVSLSYRTDQGWTHPEAVEIENFYSVNPENATYLLTSSGKGIIMSLHRADTYGSADIYISFRRNDDTWTEPLNLGMGVNSPGFEFAPFLAADGRTLYFASWAWPGYGSADLFVSRRLDDTWANWSEARNMGPGVNTDAFESSYVISGDGATVYYASSDESYGWADIFVADLPPSLRPEPVVLITGRVVDAVTDEPIPARIAYERLSDGEEMGIAFANTANGFSVALPQGERYGIYAEAEGYYAITDNIDLTSLEGFRRVERDIRMEPLTVGAVIRLNNIFFDTGESMLREESYPELNRLVDILEDNATMQIALGGYTDNVGAEAANLALSRDRANSVMQYLLSQGIASERLTSEGYGEANPVADNETEEGRQLNRRVEFAVVSR